MPIKLLCCPEMATAMILSVAMMLEWLAERHDDHRLRDGARAILIMRQLNGQLVKL